MARAPSSGLTSAEGRRFAFTLAVALTILAAVAVWRGRTGLALPLAGAGTFLTLAGLLVPHRLGPLRRGWMALGERISRFSTPIIFTVIYLLVLTPMGAIRRTFGLSPLARDRRAASYWVDRPTSSVQASREHLERKF